jgi:hypothetical protein
VLYRGCTVFEREPGEYDPAQWHQRLDEAIAAGVRERNDDLDWGSGSALVAALCVRDHWLEMTPKEQDWCVDMVCSEVEQSDRWNQLARVQRTLISGDRACATVIPLLVGKNLDESRSRRARTSLVLALTHGTDEVRAHAAAGVGQYLWPIDRNLALKCARALAAEAMLVQKAVDIDESRFREQHASHEGGSIEQLRSLGEVQAEAASAIRTSFFQETGIPEDADKNLDPTALLSAEANVRILSILVTAPVESAAIEAFERLAHTLTAWWDSDDDRRTSHLHRRERNFETESAQSRLLRSFVLHTNLASATMILKPILDAVERHPKEVGRFLEGLVYANDSNPNTPQFWSLWALFAERVRAATWLSGIDSEYPRGRELLSALFLGVEWKDGVRRWHGLDGHAPKVHNLFHALATSPMVLEKYLGFLYHVGEQSLPEAFIRITAYLQRGEPQHLLSKANSLFLLEALLQRYVYGRPLQLKKRKDLRDAVLYLLDELVEAGSSAAFRMRDDFVTPVSTA